MSHIDDLIHQHCPNGVEFRAIGEIGQLVRGNGMPKSDFVEAGVGCIHYGQIYTYYGTWTASTISFVTPEKATKLARVDPGDLIVTSTSENVDDVCKAVAWLGERQIVTGGHATVLKHEQDPKYLAYYLQTAQFHAEKKRHASGTKVIDVSAKKLAAAKRAEELDRIIAEEGLDPDATHAFVEAAFRDGAVQPTGTAITKILPPVSRFGAAGVHAAKKQSVLAKIGRFFDRFFGLS